MNRAVVLLYLVIIQCALFVRSLKFRDVNILVLTDTHSWMNSHPHPDSIPLSDATYGNLTSFVLKLKEEASRSGKDIFFLDNGDVVDGTGLSNASPIDGQDLFPLLMEIPFDAMAIGNHECYDSGTINEMISSGYISSRNGTYLSSNVYLSDTQEPIANRYTVLSGAVSGVRLITFGFLYDMKDNADVVSVEEVATTLKQQWFIDALVTEEYDAIAVLAHMDYLDPLVSTILSGIRDVVGPTMPVQFLTGHSHIRAYSNPDSFSANLEAGFYANTIGFASFDLPASPSSSNEAMEFYHDFLDMNVEQMLSSAADVLEADMISEIGKQIDIDVQVARENMGLLRELGCADKHYFYQEGMEGQSSLWELYMHSVAPGELFTPPFNSSQMLVQGTGSLRYDLFKGLVTVDDIWTLSPFCDAFMIIYSVNGADLQMALDSLNGVGMEIPSPYRHHPRAPPHPVLPAYATSSDIDAEGVYDVYCPEFDSSYIAAALGSATGVIPDVFPYMHGQVNDTSLWFAWAEEYLAPLPCDGGY